MILLGGPQSLAIKPMLQIFLQYIDNQKMIVSQRLAEQQKPSSTAIIKNVHLDALQPHDKRELLRNFFSDERIQIMISQLLIKSSSTAPAEPVARYKSKSKSANRTPMRSSSSQVMPAAPEPHLRASHEQIKISHQLQAKLLAKQ